MPHSSVSAPAQRPERPLTEIYRVAVGDVLDIRLLNSANNSSTLFTVIASGVIELPIAGAIAQRSIRTFKRAT